MARIAENLVIQRVGDDKLVLFDDSTGSETVIPVSRGTRLVAMAAYLTLPDDPQRILDDAAAHLEEVGAIQ